MDAEFRKDAKLIKEYEETFDNEERVVNSLKITSDSFSIDVGVVDFEDISFSEPTIKGRKETYLGLTTSIAELGIISPIHVMVTEGYSDWVKEGNEGTYGGYKYSVIDGLRRIFGGTKNGLTRCNAVIWDFKDKELGSELLTTIRLVLNKTQKHSWGEIWYLYQVLELQSVMSPSTLEYLLQLEPGDAMKLKDIMLCDYQDVKDELLGGKKTITQCYNMLQKYRKEEDQLVMDDNKGISEVEQAEGIVEQNRGGTLSDDEVKEILDMEGSFDGDLSDEDFDELMGNNIADDRQTVGDRHPLDPALRAAVLQRDGYCCQITGRGKGLPTPIALSILNVHHKVPVHAGGTDTMENLITISLDPHTLVHIIERNNGKLGMSKEQFDALPEDEKEFIKGVMKLARIAVEANRRVGKSKEDIRKETSDAIKFKMPGVVQAENMNAIKSADKVSRKT